MAQPQRRGCLVLLAMLCLLVGFRAEAKPRSLDLYFIDTEGGAATLIVTPQRESILIDCGNAGDRDAERIYHTVHEVAGLKAIDHLVITHWHSDHFGGVAALTKFLPIRHFYDHGLPEALSDDPQNFPTLRAAYLQATLGHARVMKPGEEIFLKQTAHGPSLLLKCLVAAGSTIPDSKDSPENPFAKENETHPDDPSDNAKSLGFILTYGPFRFLDLGDLTWNVESKLIGPTDKVGPVDVYQVSHHGQDSSNNPALLRTVMPQVAISNNGPRKGGSPVVFKRLREIPSLQALYQLHRNVATGADQNTSPEFIANNEENCRGEFIHLSVAPDGKNYTVQLGEKGLICTYRTRKAPPR